MKSRKSWPLSTLVFLLPACGQQLVEFPNPSQGTADAGIPDVPLVDAAAMEAPVFDVTTSDTSAGQLGLERQSQPASRGVSDDLETHTTYQQRNSP